MRMLQCMSILLDTMGWMWCSPCIDSAMVPQGASAVGVYQSFPSNLQAQELITTFTMREVELLFLQVLDGWAIAVRMTHLQRFVLPNPPKSERNFIVDKDSITSPSGLAVSLAIWDTISFRLFLLAFWGVIF